MTIDYSKFSDADLIALSNHKYSDLSDEALKMLYAETHQPQSESIEETPQKNIDIKKLLVEALPVGKFVSEMSKPEMQEAIKGVPQGFADLGVGLGKNIVNQKLRPMLGKEPLSEEQINNLYGMFAEEPQGMAGKVSKFASSIAPYTLIPEVGIAKDAATVAKIGNFAANAGLQGGIPMALETLKNGGDVGEGAVKGTGEAATIQGILSGIPKVGGAVKEVGKMLATKYGRILPETMEQAVKPNSVALDLNDKTAQQLLLDTTQRVRNDYADLLRNKEIKVGEELDNVPTDISFKSEDLANDLQKILSRYSRSGNPELNAAANVFKKHEQDINDLLFGSQAERVGKFKDAIDALKFEKLNKEFKTYGGNGHFGNIDTAPLNNALIEAERDTNSLLNRIKNEIIENPERLNNTAYIDKTENTLGNILRNIPLEAQPSYYDKIYEALGKGDILDKSNMTRNPLELFDINKNVSAKTKWNAKGEEEEISNEVLRSLYKVYSDRISSLNPELAKANKVYSDLMNFKNNNDAVSQILRGDLYNEGKIGNAPTALKNYKTNVTSGNKAKNVYDLEKILYDNGYKPFTNTIDDINATQNLIKAEGTGDSTIANLIKTLAVRPALKIARNANRTGFPQKAKTITEVLEPLKKLIIPAVVKSTAPTLYGGVEINDYR